MFVIGCVLNVWFVCTVESCLASLAAMVLPIRHVLSLSSMIGHNSLLCLTQIWPVGSL